MNQEIKTKWLEALRSGKYKQGVEALHWVKANTWCCLGVLCDISGIGMDTRVVNDMEEFNGTRINLPIAVMNKAGIAEFEIRELMRMNDDYLDSFEEIADYIEKEM